MSSARRTPMPTIDRIDTTAARAMPGVLGIYTYDDIADLGLLPCATQVATVAPMIVPPRPALAQRQGAPRRRSGRVRRCRNRQRGPRCGGTGGGRLYAAALRRRCRRRAAARRAGAVGHRQRSRIVSSGATRRRCRPPSPTAAHVVEIEVVNNRLVIAPMETRAAIGRWSDGTFDLFVSAASVHAIRDQLADSVFRCPRDADPGLGARCRRRLRDQELPLSRMGHAAVVPPATWAVRSNGSRTAPRISFPPRRAGTMSRAAGWRWMRTGASWRWMSAPSPAWAPTCRAAAPAVPPTRRPRRWAAATSSRRSSWMCGPPSPTPRRSTPIAAPASPRRTT